MRRFSYRAFSSDGRRSSGYLEATDAAEARRKLKADGFTVSELGESAGANRRAGLTNWLRFSRPFDQARFFSDLAVLSGAGLSFDQALRAVHAASSAKDRRTLLAHMLDRISAGSPPSTVLALIDGVSDDVIALVASGERTARLPYVLKVIAADLSRRADQRKKMIDASIYPAFLLLMMVGALAMITFVLVPTLEPIFESSERPPPFLIAILSTVRQWLEDPITVTAASLSLLGFGLFFVLNSASITGLFTLAALKLPIVGTLLNKIALGRYLQSLALLLENSVSMPEALELSAQSCAIQSYRIELSAMKESVASGKRLSDALSDTNLFPPGIVSLAKVGDEVNKLSVVLLNGANILNDEAQRAQEKLLAMLTPMITIVLGALVGGLVISVMTALLSVNDLSLQ